MFCTKCGTQVKDDDRFCPECGNVMMTESPKAKGKNHKGKQKSVAKVIILLIIFAVFVIGGIVAVLLLNNKDTDESSNKKVIKEFEDKTGDDTKEIVETIDKLFKAYEEFDIETIDALGDAPFKDFSNYSIAKACERYAKRTDDDRANFLIASSLGEYIIRFVSVDYANTDTMSKIMEYYDGKYKLKMDFEIENICTSDEIESIGCMSGPSLLTIDPDERIDSIFEGNVEVWYAVLLKGKWDINGADFGCDKDLLDYLDENLDEDNYARGLIEDIRQYDREDYYKKRFEEEGCWLIVYKYDDKWYIFLSNFTTIVYGKMLEVELK